MAEDCLGRTVGRLSGKYFLAMYPHSVAPCHNLHSELPEIHSSELLLQASSFFKNFNYNVSYPQPIFPPTAASTSELNGLDPCWSFVQKKRSWENGRAVILQRCKYDAQYAESLVNTLNKNVEHVEVPLNFVLLAEHLKKDPDENFTGKYNWYYTGGNLEVVTIKDKKYLVRPSYKEDGVILLTALKLKNNSWIPSLRETYCVSTFGKGPIYEIESLEGDFIVRQKDVITYICAKTKNDISAAYHADSQDKLPFVGVSLNPGRGEFCASTVGRDVSIWNISAKKPISEGCISEEDFELPDKWNCVSSIDINSLLFMDRRSIYLLDKRVPLSKTQKMWTIDCLSELCEDICAGTLGSNGLSYIASNHQLFSLDIRQGFSQRWTHCIPISPTMLKVVKHAGLADSVFIGSQQSDSIVFLENRWDEGEAVVSRCQPFTLPSLRESLHAARCQGICLSNVVTSRFNMSLTGMCAIEDEHISVFRCTSIGDIFQQKIRSNNNFNGAKKDLTLEDCTVMSEWEKKCELIFRKCKSENLATCVINMDHVLERVIKPDCVSSNDEADKIPENESKFNKRPEWCISKKKLYKYCDFLSPKLLEAWDLENDEEWDDRPEGSDEENDDLSDDCDDFEAKVRNWIANYASDYDDGADLEMGAEVDEEGLSGDKPICEKAEIVDKIFEDSQKKIDVTLERLDTPSKVMGSPAIKSKKKFISGF